MTAEMIRKACVDLFVCMSATVHPHQILISSTVRNAVNTATMTEQFFLSSKNGLNLLIAFLLFAEGEK